MLELNVSGHLRGRGVSNATKHLMAKGMKYHRANRLVMRKVDSISYATLEELCLACECTPDDLFVWRKDDAQKVTAEHPLHKLKPKEDVKNPLERVKKLSLKNLEKLKGLLDEMEKDGGE